MSNPSEMGIRIRGVRRERGWTQDQLANAVGVALRDPLIGDVVRVTALVFLIQAFGQSSAALLKRRLAFRALQTAQVVSSVAGYALVGITAASLGGGVWSLVAAQLA